MTEYNTSFRFSWLIKVLLLAGILFLFNGIPAVYPTVSAQQQDLVFKVQVSSRVGSHANMNEFKKFNFDYPVEEFHHKNRYKYLVGNFSTYDEAKIYRNQLMGKGIKDAFIVATSGNQIVEDWKRMLNSHPKQGTTTETVETTETTSDFEDTQGEEPVEEENLQEGEDSFGSQDEPVDEVNQNIGKVHIYLIEENIFPDLSRPGHVQKENKKKNIFSQVRNLFKSKKKKQEEEVADTLNENKTGRAYIVLQPVNDSTGSDSASSENITTQEDKKEKPHVGFVSPLKAIKYREKGKPFPYNVLSPIIYVIDTTFNSNRIIIIAVVFIFFFQLSFAVLVLFLVIARFIKSAKEAKRELLRERYQDLIADYLFSDEKDTELPQELLRLNTKMKQDVLVDEVILLHKNLTGEAYDRLIKLYLELSLHQYSIKKINSRRWHIIAKGLRELTQMNVTSAMKRIQTLTNSGNEFIRMEARLAMIRLNKSNPFNYLSNYTDIITAWEKVNIHNLIEIHKVEIPDFKTWLTSHNDSVVTFCLEMITVYKQSNAYEEILKLLNHPNQIVIQKAIIALGVLGKPECGENLKEIYNTAYYQNKIRILTALGEFVDENNILFLENVLDDNDFDLKFEAAKSLNAIGGKGQMILMDRLLSEDPELQRIIKHIFDQRI